MKCIVIGSGSIGLRHSKNLNTLGVNVINLSWRRSGLDGVLSSIDSFQPDGIVIATATDIRLILVKVCAERDIPVYIEKPLSFHARDVDAIFEAAASISSRSMVGFMMRYHPIFQAIIDLKMDDVFRFNFEIGYDVNKWRQNWRFSQSYASNEYGGGVLLDLCHELDMAYTLLPGLHLDCVQALGHLDFPGVDMAALCHLSTPSGHGTVAMDYLAPRSIRRLSLNNLTTCLDADFIKSTLTVDNGQSMHTQNFHFDRNQMFLLAMRDFLDLIRGDSISSGLLELPRMDKIRGVCDMIAHGWNIRQFNGTTNKRFE
jgi:predicted dehydrogenase